MRGRPVARLPGRTAERRCALAVPHGRDPRAPPPHPRVTLLPVADAEAGPYAVTAGPDGALWCTLTQAGRVARVGVDGRIEEFPLPGPACRPHAITADPGTGRCWFTEWGAGRVESVTPEGYVEEYDLPDAACEPHGLTVGPDGAVYVALETGALARLEP